MLSCLELGVKSGEFSVVTFEGVDECLEFHDFLNVDGEFWRAGCGGVGGEGLRGSEGLGRMTPTVRRTVSPGRSSPGRGERGDSGESDIGSKAQ